MSLPLIARWEYEFKVKEGSEEEKLVKVLRQPIKWTWCTYNRLLLKYKKKNVSIKCFD